MKIDWGGIVEGWRNKLFPPEHLRTLIKETGEERMLICSECEHNSKLHSSIRPDEHCVICTCTLAIKTLCLSCSCPINKWGCVLSKEQEDELKSDIEDGNE